MKWSGEGSRIVQRQKSNCESDLTKPQPALWGALEWVFFWVFFLAGLLYANLAHCMQAVPGRAWPQVKWLHSCSRPWRSWQMEAADCRLCNWAAGPSFERGSGWHISMFPTGDERWQNLVRKWRNCPLMEHGQFLNMEDICTHTGWALADVMEGL